MAMMLTAPDSDLRRAQEGLVLRAKCLPLSSTPALSHFAVTGSHLRTSPLLAPVSVAAKSMSVQAESSDGTEGLWEELSRPLSQAETKRCGDRVHWRDARLCIIRPVAVPTKEEIMLMARATVQRRPGISLHHAERSRSEDALGNALRTELRTELGADLREQWDAMVEHFTVVDAGEFAATPLNWGLDAPFTAAQLMGYIQPRAMCVATQSLITRTVIGAVVQRVLGRRLSFWPSLNEAIAEADSLAAESLPRY
jgi:hypothetical protein